MKNKILNLSLALLCVLLIFETGYLIGLGEETKIHYIPVNQYRTLRPLVRVQEDWSFLPREMAIMEERVNRMFEDGFPRVMRVERPSVEQGRNFFVAAMTSKETDQARIIIINLPGLDKGDIQIGVKGRYLTVQAKQKKETSANKKNSYAQELSATNFVQTVTLPENVIVQQICAEFNKGTLTITIPKDKQPKKPSEGLVNIPIK